MDLRTARQHDREPRPDGLPGGRRAVHGVGLPPGGDPAASTADADQPEGGRVHEEREGRDGRPRSVREVLDDGLRDGLEAVSQEQLRGHPGQPGEPLGEPPVGPSRGLLGREQDADGDVPVAHRAHREGELPGGSGDASGQLAVPAAAPADLLQDLADRASLGLGEEGVREVVGGDVVPDDLEQALGRRVGVAHLARRSDGEGSDGEGPKQASVRKPVGSRSGLGHR